MALYGSLGGRFGMELAHGDPWKNDPYSWIRILISYDFDGFSVTFVFKCQQDSSTCQKKHLQQREV